MAAHVFVHVGDMHFGPNERNADRHAALEQIVLRGEALAHEGRLAAWLLPGDLSHKRATIGDSNALDVVLQRMATHAPVVICYGNHDEPGDLDGFARLAASWPIHVIAQPEVLHVRTATRTMASIFCLPYPHRAGLVSAGAVHASLIDEARAALDPIFIAAAAQLQEAVDRGEPALMIGHVNVGGAIASTGQPNIGRELELDQALLARIPAGVPILLNHIHKHQVVDRAVYAGSICRLDFGENEAKGFLEWTCVAGAWAWQFVELWVPKQFLVEGELHTGGFDPDVPMPTPAEFQGCDVRVRYRYLKAESDVIDESEIELLFACARTLKIEATPTLAHELRAPEIAAAATLEEKVRLFFERHGLAFTAGVDAKLAALLSKSGEAVLMDVRAGAARLGAQPEPVRAEQAVA